MQRLVLAVLSGTLLLAACSRQEAANSPEALSDKAERIARDSIIIDTHIDVPYRLESAWEDVGQATESGDFDYPRAVAGGLNVPFMSIYTPAELEAEGRSHEVAESLIDLVTKVVDAAPGKFQVARSPADVRAHFDAGIISMPMGMENGSPISGDISNVEYFYKRGIRYITLTHSKSNHICDSSYDPNRQWNGLSDFGREVVQEMNRLGMMVDVSHVSDDTFWQVIEISEAPVIASHSSVRHFTPGFERNMDDDMIRALAGNGGVIMINYGSAFVTEAANAYSMSRWIASDAWKAEHPDLDEDAADEQFNAIWAEEHGPYPFADVTDILDHIDHAVGLVGVDHVGIGSDYDGVGDSLPTGLKDVSSYPSLVKGLLERGYSEDDVKKILGLNLLRVWEAVEEHAEAAGQAATTSSST